MEALANSDSKDWLEGKDITVDRYYTIGEVSSLCMNVKPHIIRYWESQFEILNPVRRRDRRYYRKKQIIIIRNIFELVHKKRYKVEGAIKLISNMNNIKNSKKKADNNTVASPGYIQSLHEILEILT